MFGPWGLMPQCKLLLIQHLGDVSIVYGWWYECWTEGAGQLDNYHGMTVLWGATLMCLEAAQTTGSSSGEYQIQQVGMGENTLQQKKNNEWG